MSCPSKMIRPLVMSYSRITQRARVDLPQPVSPTSPRVWPRRTSRFTPSTACTTSFSRWIRRCACTGKCLTRFSTRSSTSCRPWPGPVAPQECPRSSLCSLRLGRCGQRLAEDLAPKLVACARVVREETRGQVRRVGTDLAERRDLGAAPVHDVGAARVERAAGRQRDAGWAAGREWAAAARARCRRPAATRAAPRCRDGGWRRTSSAGRPSPSPRPRTSRRRCPRRPRRPRGRA